MQNERSLTRLKRVSADVLKARLESVKALREQEHEGYEIVKDMETGEHYLLFWYNHIQIADGHMETYHHLLPLEHDDVLAVVLGEQDYVYPDAWKHAYLRSSGEDNGYVWFDPSQLTEDETYERLKEEMSGKLAAFKKEGKLDPDAVRKLLEDLDKL